MTTEARLPGTDRLFRVEKGAPSAEELAAVTAVLLARTQETQAPAPAARPVAGWRRLERARGFDGPRTWHSTGHGPH
ncbi:acyl-CoA carboxylase subunit epsilon [Streptomyces venezuelae]|uniref:acyl-CoA carboxylase subunit epsilon n=1 Tax=Streptomyces venezuelae TaxID=54571 RepID=UPI0012393DFB|nr:acyl-CoA carboxylase subunit epsilon [Streptomyces venezuelae]QES09111.1 acyl-CoA carboxylase subunit epsilon [Streptomyces venezuelae]